VTRREFEALVERGIERIPPRFRARLKNVAFLVENEPPERGLLGLYQGRPLTERSISDPFAMPDTITIYQGPHERMADEDEMEVRRLVEETVWHEVAHYFGLDEGQVLRAERRRDLAARKRVRRLRPL
jgi:predicted Zn-dependent protease with MMP-like domain